MQAGPGTHFVSLGWPPNNADWPQVGEPAYVEFDPNSPNSRKLITRNRSKRQSDVVLLKEDGSGDPYERPFQADR